MKSSSRLKIIRHIPLLAVYLLTGAHAMDMLPSRTCQSSVNTALLHRCDPYSMRLNKVEKDMLLPVPPRHEAVVWRSAAAQETTEKKVNSVHKSDTVKTAEKDIKHTAKRHGAASDKRISDKRKGAEIPLPETIEDDFSQEVEGVTFVSVKQSPKTSSHKKRKKTSLKHEKVMHIVQKGESLIRLARRYDTTVYDIRRLNHMEPSDMLRFGQRLNIVVGAKTPPEEIRRAILLKKAGKYKVRKGDSLLKIAKRFGVSKKSILNINGLKRADFLMVGQELYLPVTREKMNKILELERKRRLAEERKKRKIELEKKAKLQKKITLKYVESKKFKHRIRVQATAYTSHADQTDSTPFIAAWNNRIHPGMKIIAVSPDLIRRYGITNGTRVKISGLPGVYVVRDKMNNRLRNHIDIYMGTNRRKALRWGRRSVILSW